MDIRNILQSESYYEIDDKAKRCYMRVFNKVCGI